MVKKVDRLFEQFHPDNYRLDMAVDPENMTFSGQVTIKGQKVSRPSQRFTFHQKELKVRAATIIKHNKKNTETIKVVRINNQNSLDEVRLHTNTMLYPGSYTISMKFEGKITKPMNGIYPCFFKHGGKSNKLIATQFESHHAREAFPCIDEPEAKAIFDLTLTSPAGDTVLSNTPVKTTSVKGEKQISSFETTPRMSVYLLAFVFGKLKNLETVTKNGIKVGIYATPDNAGLMQHGLDVAVRGLEFFVDYFAVDYPLPKLDVVALPDFSVGAMENWGLITFRETALLTDPKTSSLESRQMVALVVAHELSHQWFGNLVTMKWWDDLWLNESFANLMEYRAVEALYPEWHIWEQFVNLETGNAKRRDSLADVQPIHTEVNHPDEINTVFDHSIVYAKGGSVLYMLMHYVGEDKFRKGLTAYFEKNRYGNTVADDLWAALGKVAKEDIGKFMNNWVTRPGYPLVSVDWVPGSEKIILDQQRFYSDPMVKPTNENPWPVPLAATYQLSEPLFEKHIGNMQVKIGDGPLLLNHNGYSYFLPRYIQSAHLDLIVKSIKAGKVDNIDRLLLMDNYNLLQRGGMVATTEMLELLKGYSEESGENVWSVMAAAIGEVRRLVEDDEVAEAKLDNMIRNMAVKLSNDLGWDDKQDDSPQTLRLRSLTQSITAAAKDKLTIKEGLKRVNAFTIPADLPPSTRTVIYYIGARYGQSSEFNKLLKLHETVTNADEKEELAGALTATKDPKHYKILLEMLTTDSVRRQDLMHWFVWLLRNRYSRQSSWNWMTSHWDWIDKEMSSEKTYSYFPRYAGSIFSRTADLKKYQAFFDPLKRNVALGHDIKLGEQEIASRIAWRQRNEKTVIEWLRKS
ncbi:MAG TPA: M1 family metallopeptidase [Candidatus Saccharimonadales bacterium]|nr:M1 family metallopeptidase [Candidatus Saccharimonadales bacterium]